MNLSEYPIVKLLLSIIIGILLASYIDLGNVLLYAFGILLILFTLIAWPKKYFFSYKNRFISGIIIFVFFISIGALLFQYHFNYSKSNHFAFYQKQSSSLLLKITEPPQQKDKTVKVFAEVIAVNNDSQNIPTIGNALLYLQKDGNSNSLEYGDLIAFHKGINETEPPSNPDQFNYQKYLYLKGVQHQSYGRSGDWSLVQKARISPMGLALKLRLYLLDVLRENNIEEDELSVAAGMLLGVRDMLSPELRDAYSGAGAMHILCVSGLHVGILYMIIAWSLSFMSETTRNKLIKSIIILTIIWLYAMLTGFSPSVVRSATMFSFIAIGSNLKRHVNIIGSLSSSAFVLLVYDPTLIFNLGFQLSYSAVLSIVIIQPALAKLWYPKYKVVDYFWQLTTVSVAAQIGTAPLSIYYFHQFPNYFILTNFIVIPAAYVIIMLGIAVIITSFIPFISAILGKILSFILMIVNSAITGIEQMDYAVTRGIYISEPILVLLILFVIFMSAMLLLKKRKLIFINQALVILILIAANFNFDKDDEFVIYKTSKSTYMAIYSGDEVWILADSTILKDPEMASFSISGHELKKGISKYHYLPIDDKPKVTKANFKIDYPFIMFGDNIIMLNNSPIDHVVADVDYYFYTNYKNAYQRPTTSDTKWIISQNIPIWEKEKLFPKLDSLQIVAHDIYKDGAWVMKF